MRHGFVLHQPRETPYQRGYREGVDGHTLQYQAGEAGAQYRSGWYDGYRCELDRVVCAYNQLHGTDYKPRI